MQRRMFMIGAGLVAATGALRPVAGHASPTLTPPEAFARAASGAILLIDIRRPDEWAATGVGQGARPLDMRRRDFGPALLALAGGNPATPIALICARGGRSNRLARRLADAGFAVVQDVPEGMLGSRAGPGWLARGLPVTRA
jgi:rhodanese-related sulfurtransferase